MIKLLAMIGFGSEQPPGNIDPDLCEAVAANERAGRRAQQVLEDMLKDKGNMSGALREITGRM